MKINLPRNQGLDARPTIYVVERMSLGKVTFQGCCFTSESYRQRSRQHHTASANASIIPQCLFQHHPPMLTSSTYHQCPCQHHPTVPLSASYRQCPCQHHTASAPVSIILPVNRLATSHSAHVSIIPPVPMSASYRQCSR